MIEIPASFRIFGFGENTKQAIDQLTALGYDGVSTVMVNKEAPTPTDMDKMTIEADAVKITVIASGKEKPL